MVILMLKIRRSRDLSKEGLFDNTNSMYLSHDYIKMRYAYEQCM